MNTHEDERQTFKCTGICSTCGRCQNGHNMAGAAQRKTRLLHYPADFVPTTGQEGYGIAFDVGTTTLVGILWNRETGKQVGVDAQTNPQNKHGLDVISRITYCQGDPEKLAEMQGLVTGCMQTVAEKLCKIQGISTSQIQVCTICGNTTMSHIIAGYDPKLLAVSPFTPSYTGTLVFKAAKLGLSFAADASVTLVPNIASHVGGDITTGVVASGMQTANGLIILIDIGTNGEIVMSKEGVGYACSTAAGPAFEGATIYHGMRAAEGAIEAVQIQEDVTIKTIGDAAAVGICGSGLIQAVGEMVKNKVVNGRGKMATQEELEAKGLPAAVCQRCRTGEMGREFVLSYGKDGGTDVVITQKDIREVQLAKGAIAAGIVCLLEEVNATVADIEQLYIAGAFGSFIDKQSAVDMGLLPNIDLERLVSVGNTAGVGCAMALMNQEDLRRMEEASRTIQHVELSTSPTFQANYMKNMSF
ncbi:ASKHA domain-containing protein [Bengtsoniella intestinalis]|uniref:ASKHA domain-containing protein n=1 Tax=Bengtsoniella intestinalis TaxID=3073143 RepID=UPI00391F1BDF